MDKLLFETIGNRVNKYRTSTDYLKSEVHKDRALISHIEGGTIKPGNSSFIPDKQIQVLADSLGLEPKQLIFGDEQELEQYVKACFERLAYNIKGIDIELPHIQYDEKYDEINLKFRTAFLQWAEFALANGKAESVIQGWWLEDVHFSFFQRVVDAFWEQNCFDIIDSFTNKFLLGKITLRNYQIRLDEWIETSLTQILDNSIDLAKQHEIYQIGYDVAFLMNIYNDWNVKFNQIGSDQGDPLLLRKETVSSNQPSSFKAAPKAVQKTKHTDLLHNNAIAALHLAEELTNSQKKILRSERLLVSPKP